MPELGEGGEPITSRVEKTIVMFGNRMEWYILSVHVMELNGEVQNFGTCGLYL